MKILIVDDSKAMRGIVMRALRQAGFGGHVVTEAVDGQAAWEAICTEAPGLVLSDWNMPRLTGIELLQKVRTAGVRSHFGFVTSEASQPMRDLAIQNGADFFVTKPFTPEDFQRELSKVMPVP